MRVVRLFAAVLTILTAGLLWATPVGAQPPTKLTDHLTDSNRVLTDSDRAAVSSAIDRLYRDRHIQLWVVYVDNFNKFKPDNWADRTRSESGMGDRDVLLAVATNTKLFTLNPPPQLQNPTADELNSLRTNKIGPAVSAKNWAIAAIAAADGLDTSPSVSHPASPAKRAWLPIAIAVIAVVVVVVVLLLVLYRARRRRRAARGVGPGGPQDRSLGEALSTAEARLRQISDYVARHHDSVGADARSRLDEATRHLAAAHAKQASNDTEAIAHANRASTLAAEAQHLANDDVLGAHRTTRRRGAASKR